MKKKAFFRVDVAPLTVLPQNRSPFFSYVSSEKIPSGSLVSLPFSGRKVRGVVWESAALPSPIPHWMKFVEKIEYPKLLNEKQLLLARWMSEAFFAPLGNTLKHFLVLPPQKKKAVSSLPWKAPFLPPLPVSEQKIIRSLAKFSSKPAFLHSSPFSSFRLFLSHLLKEERERGGQVLFLVPELFLAEWWKQELEQEFPLEEIALIHSQMKKSEIAFTWEKTRVTTPLLVIGTRQALFAPFAKLSTILVSDEEDETSYKQWEMSPRYRVRETASELASLHHASLVFLSSTPSLSIFQSLREKTVRPFSLTAPPSLSPLTLVNMRLEKKKYRIFSSVLEEKMRATFLRQEKIFLIGSQPGFTTVSLCAKCRTVMRCPRSGHALVGKRAGHFSCLQCGYTTDVFPKCQACGHMVFKSFGIGTEKIEKEVETLFPKATILRLDRRALRPRKELARMATLVRQGKFDVLIGINSFLKMPNLPEISLIAMIEADRELLFPDYRAEEKLTQSAFRARLLAGREVIFQTFDPEKEFFRTLRGNSFEKISERLLRDREALGYPPATRFLKIESLGATSALSLAHAKTIEKALWALIQKEKLPFSVVAPHLPLTETRKKHYQLFLRLPHALPLPKNLLSLLGQFSSIAHYDKDPLTLH